MVSPKSRRFWPLLSLILLADCATKRLAVEHLPERDPQSLVGDAVRLTLAYNPGAVFGVSLGPLSRWVLLAASAVILAALMRIYRRTAHDDALRASALGLVVGGALGNLVDRVRSPLGVVDFVDLGLHDTRFWTFNIADVGVSVGAALLVWSLMREDAQRAERPRA